MIGDTIKREAGKAGKVICPGPCSPHSHGDAGNREHLLIELQGTAEAAPEIAHVGCRCQGRRTGLLRSLKPISGYCHAPQERQDLKFVLPVSVALVEPCHSSLPGFCCGMGLFTLCHCVLDV